MNAADAESPAVTATRARCREVKILIGTAETTLGPVILPTGQLNSLSDASPPNEAGGYVLVVMEPIHGDRCAMLRPLPRPCSCGAQATFERLILR